MPRTISSSLVETVVADYKDGFNGTQLSRKYGISDSAIYNFLAKHHVDRRLFDGGRVSFDEHFFDEIDSEHKAYWLGFFTADGCVFGNRIQLSLCVRDYAHLAKFCVSLNTKANIEVTDLKTDHNKMYYSDKTYTRCRVRLSSPAIVKALANLGVYPSKSLKETVSEGVPKYLTRHYWRGIIDGDGSIGEIKNRKGTHFYLDICGSENIVTSFHKMAINICRSKVSVRRRPNGLFMVRYTGLTAAPLAYYLYDTASIYLDRKFETYERLIKEVKASL